MQKSIMSEIQRDIGEIKANIKTLTKQMDIVFSFLDEVKKATITQNGQIKNVLSVVQDYEIQRNKCVDRFESIEKSTSSKAIVAVGSFIGTILAVLYLIIK